MISSLIKCRFFNIMVLLNKTFIRPLEAIELEVHDPLASLDICIEIFWSERSCDRQEILFFGFGIHNVVATDSLLIDKWNIEYLLIWICKEI